MMMNVTSPLKGLRALRIDPERRVVEEVHVHPMDLKSALGAQSLDAVDLGEEHCLVFDNGGGSTEHPTRFRFKDALEGRPWFGVTLILGLVHRNWTSATLQAEDVNASIRWEVWDAGHGEYAAPAMAAH